GGANLASLVGTENSLTAQFSGGSAAGLTPAPEPALSVLLGLGLLVLVACYLRQRRIALPPR
ncbi:MAG: PEP-CTERM sorting domain-containing protein, partial [Terriglobales bacterium]